MRKILVVVAAVAFSAAACGSDSNKNADTVGGGSTTAAAGDSADLEKKLLTTADLPAGFRVEEPSPDDESSSSDSGCEALDNLEEDVAPEEATAEFARANEQEASFQFLNEAIGRYSSESEADKDFDKAVAAFRQCESFTSTDPDGSVTTGSLSALRFPKLEDDTLAVQMTATYTSEGQSFTMEGAVVAVRSGRLVALLMSLNLGENALTTADFEAIVRKAADKL